MNFKIHFYKQEMIVMDFRNWDNTENSGKWEFSVVFNVQTLMHTHW